MMISYIFSSADDLYREGWSCVREVLRDRSVIRFESSYLKGAYTDDAKSKRDSTIVKSINLFKAAINKDPKNSGSLYLHGTILFEYKFSKKSLEDLNYIKKGGYPTYDIIDKVRKEGMDSLKQVVELKGSDAQDAQRKINSFRPAHVIANEERQKEDKQRQIEKEAREKREYQQDIERRTRQREQETYDLENPEEAFRRKMLEAQEAQAERTEELKKKLAEMNEELEWQAGELEKYKKS